MKASRYAVPSLLCGLGIVLLLVGCGCRIGGAPRVKHTRTMRLSAPLAPGAAFAATTYNGAIEVAGADVADCNLVATIIARAETKEEAQQLAEQTQVKLVPSENKLEAKITRPKTENNQSIAVNLNARVPKKIDLYLVTHNGAVSTSDITGKIDGSTHNGAVTATNISGEMKLKSHNGCVACSKVSGNAYLKTYNGAVKLSYLKTAPPDCEISVVTHNGGIEVTTPPNLSAKVSLSTHNGSIKSGLPIKISGEISKTRLKGTIGAGQGKLQLETYNGSITVK